MSAQELITQYLDIWTAAHKTRSSAGRGSSNKLDLYGIKKLRELILELAVRGKLVSQDANDEPASELLNNIAAEKARLVKEGSIKKDRDFPAITDEEYFFDLPIGWQWARLEDVGRDWGQKAPSGSFTYIDVSAIDNTLGKIVDPTVLSAEDAPSRARKIVVKGTVIYSTIRPYLQNIAVIENDFSPEAIASTAFAILHPLLEMPARYFSYYLRSPAFIKYVESVQTGIAYPAINDKQFYSGVVPIPPLPEQHRIVAKVDELMAFCDQLEQTQSDNIAAHAQLVEALLATLTNSSDHNELQNNWQRIAAHFNTLFTTEHSIDQLKQTILQLAVMGKLVPQNPNDEPASELLKKIDRELCQKIGQNQLLKLERDKSTIDPAEFHWGIPDSWTWCELQDIALFENGKAHEQFVTEEDKYVLINSSFVSNSGEKVKYVSERLSPLEQGDMAIVMSDVPNGRALVRCYLVETNNRYTLNQRIGCLKFSNDVSKKYLHIVLNRNKYYLSYDDGKKQTNLKKVQVLSCPIPLPSVAEQNRIVTKVDELMTLCDTLKTNLQNAQTTQLVLADALVEQAVN